MSLELLKRTVAQVEVDGVASGTAFLIDRRHVATALHVLAGYKQATLLFVEWPKNGRQRNNERKRKDDRKRAAELIWRHPAGYDVAILRMDEECPADVQPQPWSVDPVTANDHWLTFGFPEKVANGLVVPEAQSTVADPALAVAGWDLRVLQLYSPLAVDGFAGLSGAPCMIGDAIVGIISHQLTRTQGEEQAVERKPVFTTLYALPVKGTLIGSPIAPPIPEHVDNELSLRLLHVIEAATRIGKASLLAKLLRVLDRSAAALQPQRAAIAQRLDTASRIVVNVVWRREFARGREFAEVIYKRLTRSPMAQTAPGLRIPTFLHDERSFLLDARRDDAAQVEHTVFVMLVDDGLIADPTWRASLTAVIQRADGELGSHSVLPISLGTPKRMRPLDTLKVSHLDATTGAVQLLILVELHLLGILAQRRGEARQRRHAKLFLSYATIDGLDMALAIKHEANQITNLDVLMDRSGLAPGERLSNLEREIEDRVLVALVTPRYTSRSWCRRELLAAKRLGRPMVVVDAQPPCIPRSFPYLSNAAHVRYAATDVHGILEMAIFGQLSDEYARLYLEDQALVHPSLQHAHIVTRAPELLDVVGSGALAHLDTDVVLHPDPPLSEEEQNLLNNAVPDLKFLTPAQAAADEQSLRSQWGTVLRIGLSASAPDTFPPGMSLLHFEDAWLDLIRMLLLGGATLVFGGDLRPNGLTDQLLEVARQRIRYDERGGLQQRVPIRSYLSWPYSLCPPHERQIELIDVVEFIGVPEARSSAEHVGPPELATRYREARSLTRMRSTMLQEVDALVVIGGRCAGYGGRYPGVLEETLLAMRLDKPVFLLGGLGGATAAMIDVLHGKTLSIAACTPEFMEYYNATVATDTEAEDAGPIDTKTLAAFFERSGIRGLRNTLQEPENQILHHSSTMQEVAPLLLKGLRQCLAALSGAGAASHIPVPFLQG